MGRRFANIEWVTAICIFLLCFYGLFLLLTLGVGVFFQQLVFVIVGFILLFTLSSIDVQVLWWFAPIGYVFGNILLILSYLGPQIRGASRWISIAGIQLQPSELAKPIFLLAFSYFIAKFPPRYTRNIPLHIVLFLIPFLLVFKQPDLGSSIIYAAMWLAMMLAGGLSVSYIALSVVGGVLLFPFLWTHLLPYQKNRVLTFLDPALDPKGAGYNALQAMIAVGSGLVFGRGLGRGTQSHLRFLPEHHTDFIFATLVEELGFAGGILLFLFYIALLVRIILPFLGDDVHDPRFFIFSFGLFSMIFAQVFINTGMNMGLIPVTGITLPFISYGGSSILSLCLSFGILWALRRGKPDDPPIAIL